MVTDLGHVDDELLLLLGVDLGQPSSLLLAGLHGLVTVTI